MKKLLVGLLTLGTLSAFAQGISVNNDCSTNSGSALSMPLGSDSGLDQTIATMKSFKTYNCMTTLAKKPHGWGQEFMNSYVFAYSAKEAVQETIREHRLISGLESGGLRRQEPTIEGEELKFIKVISIECLEWQDEP